MVGGSNRSYFNTFLLKKKVVEMKDRPQMCLFLRSKLSQDLLWVARSKIGSLSIDSLRRMSL